MLQCDNIRHLKIFRMKCYLPFLEDKPTKDSIIICNTLTQGFGENEIIKHKSFDNNRAHYRRVYMDRKLVKTINKKKVVRNLTNERKISYDDMRKSYQLAGITEGNLKNKMNLMYDLSQQNKLFFQYTNKLNIKKQSKMYIEYLNSCMEIPLMYKKRTMFISIDEMRSMFPETPVSKLFTDPRNMRNPLSLLYLCLKYNSEEFYKLGDLNIIIFSSKGPVTRVNPRELKELELHGKRPFNEFRKIMIKLAGGAEISDNQLDKLEEKNLNNEEVKINVVDTIMNEFVFGANQTINEEIKENIVDIVNNTNIDTDNVDKVINIINNDEKIVKDINKIISVKKTGGHHASTKRDELLKEKQMDLKVKNKTLKEIVEVKNEDTIIPEKDISNAIFSTNKNLTKKKFCNYDRAYNEVLKEADTMNILTDLNNKSIPVYVKSIDVEDSSDILNYKETYKVVLEDSNRIRHNLTFDMPKILDDKFIYIGGNKKILNNQQLLLPIVKTDPDTVQTVTNYNKIFVRRYGTKVSSEIEKFKKAVTSGAVPKCKFKRGNYLKLNSDYLTTIEYDSLSKTFERIEIGNVKILFDQPQLHQEIDHKKLKNEGIIPIGYEGDRVLFLNTENNNIVGTNKTIIEYLCSKSPEIDEVMKEQSAGKKYMYTRATIMKKQVPLILLLAYFEGLDNILRRAKVKYYFSDTKPRVNSSEGIVEFNNGYLVYEKKPFDVSLLMNAFVDIPTKMYNYEDFNEKEIYPDIFESMFNRRGIAGAFNHFYDNFVDPITYRTLEDLNLPTDITGMLLYANNLLVDNQFKYETDPSIMRIRRNEIFNAILYKKIATAYEKYSDTANNSNPQKISIPKDSIIKEILKQQTLEDYSTLNPIVELEKVRATSPKGPSGCNLDDAYKMNKRSFHEGMTGLFTISTSPDKNVGVVRELTFEPTIVSARGYLDSHNRSNFNELKDINLFGAGELLSPLGATRDDGIRLAMATKQSKHIVPVENACPVLISNGAEQSIQYELSNDFAVTAKENGKVIERDDKTGLVVIQYKSGKYEAIDINPRTVKNGAGGFYLTNRLVCDLKVGQTVKENDVLASDSKFFTNSKVTGNRFNIGTLCKVAIMSSYATYEDSTEVTTKMAREMASSITMNKSVVLGANTNVDYMVKIGDKVEVGDELIRFERSFNEDLYNKLLANIGEDIQEEITMSSKEQVKSKYSGTITDIKIYSTVELDQLSPSLRKIVSDYYNKIKKRKKLLDKYDKNNDIVKCGILFNDPTGPIDTPDGKVKGHIVNEGVLIEIYVTYLDELGVGDKITNFTALKSTIGDKIPEGLEPYTPDEPDEEISTCIAPAAIIARMTPSIVLTLLGNKVLVYLKRRLKEIYDGKR